MHFPGKRIRSGGGKTDLHTGITERRRRVMMMRRAKQVFVGGVLLGGLCAALSSISPRPVAAQTCVGDCNRDLQVTVNELITGVNIALQSINISACTADDVN